MVHSLLSVHFDYVASGSHEGHGLLCPYPGRVSVIEVTNCPRHRVFPEISSPYAECRPGPVAAQSDQLFAPVSGDFDGYGGYRKRRKVEFQNPALHNRLVRLDA
jgi:hypothetical protein